MADANVKLSDAELMLVCNEQFILTKNRIIEKVYSLFGALSEEFYTQVKNQQQLLPTEVLSLSAKIFRGENYKELPYVTLDYPRAFSKEKIFAIRCFFWWGKFFSITLHLSGDNATTFGPRILRKLPQQNSWYVCVNNDQWQHHFDIDNYQLADKNLLKQIYSGLFIDEPFLKIAKKIPLQQWEHAHGFFTSAFNEIINLLE